MGQAEIPPRTIRFGPFEVDPATSEVRKHGSPLRLQEQPFRILIALLNQPGEVVSREELTRRLWPDGTIVDFERGLNAAVTRLRQALHDSAENPRYIETVARRGYRFVGTIESSDAKPATAVIPRRATPRKPLIWTAATVAACLAIGAGWWSTSRRPATSERQLAVTPLTSDPGFGVCPTFSPDGNQVAYEWDQGRREPRIFVKVINVGEPIRLTKGSVEETCPAWSPDGKYIAFLRSVGESLQDIIIIPALGGAERKLAEYARGIPYYPHFRPRLLAWTPDAKHLIAVIPNENSFSRLFAVSVDSGELTPMMAPEADAKFWDRDPAISPDGRFVAFTRETTYGASDLLLVTLSSDLRAAGEPRRLTRDGASGRFADGPAWMPDGSAIVYCSNHDGTPRLWSIGLQPGSMPRQVPSVGPDSSLPVISGQGRLAFAHVYWDANVWRQELALHGGKRSAPERLLASTAQDSSAQYSPDGRQVAYQSARSGSYEVWICGSDGARCRQLTSFRGPITGMPRWSPDGKKIAFDSAAVGTFDIYVIGVEGGSAQRITFDPANAVAPNWSRDGKWIYFSSRRTGRHEIWKVPSSGGTALQITHNGGFASFESPDGQNLYYTKKDMKSDLFRSGVDGSEETRVAEDTLVRGLALTDRQIFYLRAESEPGVATLRSLDLSTGRDAAISTITKLLDLGLSVTPDLTYAIYSEIDSEGSTLMLVDEFR